MIHAEQASDADLFKHNKADLSFKLGYESLRSTQRQPLVIHIIQFIILIVFFPLDLVLLSPSANIIIVLSIALFTTILCFVIEAMFYYQLFAKDGLLGYVALAKEIGHSTDEPISFPDSLDDVTSKTMLYCPTRTTVNGVQENIVTLYGNYARQEIDNAHKEKYGRMNCWTNVYHFFGLGTVILAVVMMATAEEVHLAEVLVLVAYMLLQSYLEFILLLILLVIAISPILCVGAIIWCCCCAEKQDDRPMVLDIPPKKATVEEVVASGGDCAICLQEIKAGENVYQLRCSQKHVFHCFCLDNWMRVKGNCPTCRADLPMRPVEQGVEPLVRPEGA